jgi:hypothetical protein
LVASASVMLPAFMRRLMSNSQFFPYQHQREAPCSLLARIYGRCALGGDHQLHSNLVAGALGSAIHPTPSLAGFCPIVSMSSRLRLTHCLLVQPRKLPGRIWFPPWLCSSRILHNYGNVYVWFRKSIQNHSQAVGRIHSRNDI